MSATECKHCGQPAPEGREFCCAGCAAAFDTIQDLGLGQYYRQRILDPDRPPPRPQDSVRPDLSRFIVTEPAGQHSLTLAVDGLQCGACVWLIESVLGQDAALSKGRVNMTTRRLQLAWSGDASIAQRLVAKVEALGYRLVPFDAAYLKAAADRTGRDLVRALAVAGFAAGNVMMFSAAIWAGLVQGMGPGTRTLMHFFSAVVAVPAIAYAGRPFFRSAWAALRQRRTNMDVPISIGVTLVTALSLMQTMRGAEEAYFDSAVSLLFFLLLGRVMDHRARAQARATAEQLLALRASDVAVLAEDGTLTRIQAERIAPGQRILAGMGERIGADGTIEVGETLLDTALVTGESVPRAAGPGTVVFAGTLNLGAPITIRATATGSGTLLAECARLIEAAEARRGRFVMLADRVARAYAPTVHLAALTTFLGWFFIAHLPVADALLIACAVLIITCPCALALAVPVVQVLATGALFRIGILLKSPTALERLAEINTIVFDKTGTLTEPDIVLVRRPGDEVDLAAAAPLAAASRHPLARALAAGAAPAAPPDGIVEVPGQGMRYGETRLGSAAFTGSASDGLAPELWLTRPDHLPVRFSFAETLRADAKDTIGALRAAGLELHLLSGDREAPVAALAATLGVAHYRAACTPPEKVAALEALRDAGRKVLMVGDGLNDAPCLAAAHVSMSPSTAADISQTVADIVFQGTRLRPVLTVLKLARTARAVMRENIGLAIAYNALMVPLAVAGYVTPWLAAAAMSSSSLLVMANSFRVRRGLT